MDWLVQLEQGALGIVFVFSFAFYIKRTGDKQENFEFFSGRTTFELTRQEFIINRVELK